MTRDLFHTARKKKWEFDRGLRGAGVVHPSGAAWPLQLRGLGIVSMPHISGSKLWTFRE